MIWLGDFKFLANVIDSQRLLSYHITCIKIFITYILYDKKFQFWDTCLFPVQDIRIIPFADRDRYLKNLIFAQETWSSIPWSLTFDLSKMIIYDK